MKWLFYSKSLFSVALVVTTAKILVACSSRQDSLNQQPSQLQIIGGQPVAPGDYPEVVALMRDQLTICSGTLIDKDLILTAAHCLEKTINSGAAALATMTIVFGSQATNLDSPITAKIIQAQIHPLFWQDQRGAMDFAWIKIEPPDLTIPVASLPHDRSQLDRQFDGPLENHTTAEIVGFGVSARNGEGSAATLGQKRQAKIPIGFRSGIELFAGSAVADSCSGDSGGPLFLTVPRSRNNPQGRLLAGVTSRGPMPCASDFGQGAYGLTSEVICWLRSSVGWHSEDPQLSDFCIREVARATATSVDPVIASLPFKEACVSEDLAEDSRQDLETLLKRARIRDPNPAVRCQRLENYLRLATHLDISSTQFRQVGWLRVAQKMERLNAQDNLIVDASPLSELGSLSEVDLRNNRIMDLTALKKLAEKTRLVGLKSQWSNIDDTRYRELAERGAALSSDKRALVVALRDSLVDGSIPRKSRDLAMRRYLNLDRRGVRSLEAITGLENLEALSLANNSDIDDWNVLLTLPQLKQLRLSSDARMPSAVATKLQKKGTLITRTQDLVPP